MAKGGTRKRIHKNKYEIVELHARAVALHNPHTPPLPKKTLVKRAGAKYKRTKPNGYYISVTLIQGGTGRTEGFEEAN